MEEKRQTVSSPLGAGLLARELVDILVDVIGYRGRQPVIMKSSAGGRTQQEATFEGVVIGDVNRVAELTGMSAIRCEPRPQPALDEESDSPAATKPVN